MSGIAVKDGTVWAAGRSATRGAATGSPTSSAARGSWSEVPLLGRPAPGPTGCKVADDGRMWRGARRASRSGATATSTSRGPAQQRRATGPCCAATAAGAGARRLIPGRCRRPAGSTTWMPSPAAGSRRRRGGHRAADPPGRGPELRARARANGGQGDLVEIDRPGPATYAVGTRPERTRGPHPAAYRLAGGTWRSQQVSINFGNPFGVSLPPAGQAWPRASR